MKKKIRLTEGVLRRIIRESLSEIDFGNISKIDNGHVTPYTPEEREQNFLGLKYGRNNAYEGYKKWYERMKDVLPKEELNWDNYVANYQEKFSNLLESVVRKVVNESLSEIDLTNLNESKSIKSGKLQKIFSEHGGLWKDNLSRGRHVRNYAATDFHNMSDADVLGVINKEQLDNIQRGHTIDHWRWADNKGLDIWAKENGVNLERGDRVEYEKLGDGMYLVYVERNAEFEHSGREGGFKDFYNKKEERRVNGRHDGFEPMSDKAKAARDLRHNPYFWGHKNGEMRDPQSGWSNPERRKEAFDNAKVGKDVWGYPALTHYKNTLKEEKQ